MERSMQYKGVAYTLKQLPDGDTWQYHFEIGGRIIVGRPVTRLKLLAARRAERRINRALNELGSKMPGPTEVGPSAGNGV
jgi:hypothetical protein